MSVVRFDNCRTCHEAIELVGGGKPFWRHRHTNEETHAARPRALAVLEVKKLNIIIDGLSKTRDQAITPKHGINRDTAGLYLAEYSEMLRALATAVDQEAY